VADGNNHLLVFNQILDADICFVNFDGRSALIAETIFNLGSFTLDNTALQSLVGQNGLQFGYFFQQFFILQSDLVASNT
jgi:hypothetical protein